MCFVGSHDVVLIEQNKGGEKEWWSTWFVLGRSGNGMTVVAAVAVLAVVVVVSLFPLVVLASVLVFSDGSELLPTSFPLRCLPRLLCSSPPFTSSLWVFLLVAKVLGLALL